MITMTTSSSSNVKPAVRMDALLRIDVRPQGRRRVLAARRIGYDDRRAQHDLPRRVEGAPVVVAELEVVLVPGRVEAELAGVVDDLLAVEPHLQEAAAALALLELHHDVHPAAERDRAVRIAQRGRAAPGRG